MKIIVKNEYYMIGIDERKNRLYLTISGFWESNSVVPNFFIDFRKAVSKLSPDYTILADVTQMKTPPADVATLHTKVQQMAIFKGLKKTAEVVNGNMITKMAINRYSRQSGMNKKIFHDRKKAETWLDEK